MTTIYLISNNLTMSKVTYSSKDSLELRREKRLLSVEGEKESEKLSYMRELQDVQAIFASPYVMSIGTAKYLASRLDLNIETRLELGEREIGDLGDKKIRMVNEMQENDFDYKLPKGESLNDVKRRMLYFIDGIKSSYQDKTVAIYSHNIAITSFLSEYCEKGFNLDNRLILNYQDEVIIDGAWSGVNVIEMKFEQYDLVSIKRLK